MSRHFSATADRRASRRNRLTVWPAVYGEDAQADAPWSGRYGPDVSAKRWTGAFDVEARANRMSVLVGDSLLPAARSDQQQQQWPGQRRTLNRTTWVDEGPPEIFNRRMWAGHFEVENRSSWISRNSDRWSDDLDREKEKEKSREPPTPEQLAQANSDLVSADILNYDFPGYGTPEDPYLISWIENDPANPMRFSQPKKWANAMGLAFAVFMVSIASSGFSQGKKSHTQNSRLMSNLQQALRISGQSLTWDKPWPY